MTSRALALSSAGLAAALAAALAACSSGKGATPAPGVTIAVTPAQVVVTVGGTARFSATVTGASNAAVTWTVQPAGCGVVADGAFTAPAAPATCQVVATSAADVSRSGSAGVTAVPAASTRICGAAAGQLFPPLAPWNVPVDAAPLDAQSGEIIATLAANHTGAHRFEITFDFDLLYAHPSTSRRAFTRTSDFYSPDCDPAPVPVPPGGRLEGEPDYRCASGGDCHLTVIDPSSCRLYEMWRADLSDGTAGGAFSGGCLAIWDLASAPPETERGDYCTSADAAGLPILPLVFTADEVAAGSIEHALRFILPNALIRHDVYVRPATHSTRSTAGGPGAPPYGARLRLKAGTDLAGLSRGGQVVARALQRYGMILADGGAVTFTAATDDLTVHRWADVGLSARDLMGLSWNDFEVVELGARHDWTSGDCARAPITD